MCLWYFEIPDYWSTWPLPLPDISICIHLFSFEVLWVSSLETKLSFVYCTYSILLRQTSQDMFIFSIGQSGFSRPSDQWCSLAVMENESILFQICHDVHLLVSIMSLYLCGEHNTIAIHVYCSDYEYCMLTTLIAATASYILYAWGPYQIVYV